MRGLTAKRSGLQTMRRLFLVFTLFYLDQIEQRIVKWPRPKSKNPEKEHGFSRRKIQSNSQADVVFDRIFTEI